MLAGYPVVDVKVTLMDGSYHDVDSSEMAFKIAGSMAFKDAVKRASPVLLEPIMEVEVVTPEEYMGDVIGDLASRRGQIVWHGGPGLLAGDPRHVPLATMFGYATDLRSATQGRATYIDAVRPLRGDPDQPGRRDHGQGGRASSGPRGLPLSERLGRTDEWPRRSSSGPSRT